MTKLTTATWLCTAFVVLASPSIGQAQEGIRSFSDLPQVLEVGQVVSVTTGGAKTRGRLLDISPTAIVVGTTDTKRVFSPDMVTTIRRGDRLTNGMSIGGHVGAGLGILALVLSKGGIFRPCSSDSAGSFYTCASVIIAGIGGAGVGIGAAIDRSVEELVYTAPTPTTRVTWSPLFGHGRLGVSAALRF